jgi:hypothetical protein
LDGERGLLLNSIDTVEQNQLPVKRQAKPALALRRGFWEFQPAPFFEKHCLLQCLCLVGAAWLDANGVAEELHQRGLIEFANN